ncbi:MAG: HD domain-containing protein [Clostridiaceae bacterium]
MEIHVKRISEYNIGERVDSFLIIKRVDLKTTNASGKKYLDFILGDATGEISGKLWEVPVDAEDLYQPSMVVRVRGTITNYQNTPQFKIERIRPVSENDNVNPSDLVLSAPLNPENMFEEILNKYIDSMDNMDIKNITEKLFMENEGKLHYYPAAKRNHHSIRSGLLYHMLTMLKLAEKVCEIYDFLNRDLLFAGVILHDMSKLDEMDSSDLGIVSEYTVEGILLGHITQGVKNIDRAARELGTSKEVTMLLQHMVLSHHYEPDYGSPVKPMFPEAEVLHHIDMIDARMYDMKNAVSGLEKGTFSDYILSLDRRRIYKPDLESTDHFGEDF